MLGFLGSWPLCGGAAHQGVQPVTRAWGKQGLGRKTDGKEESGKPHAESRNPEEGSRDLLASMDPLQSRLRSTLRSNNWIGSSDWKGSPVPSTQAPPGGGGRSSRVRTRA